MRTLIITEAGVNHNGSLDIAKKLARTAKECGADIVKFQTANLYSLVSKNAEMAEYQKKNTNTDTSQLEMLKKLLLSYSDFELLAEYCKEIGIKFLSTPFDLESISFLDSIGCDIWKIPSGEITNLPYLERIASTEKKIILSTGMSEMSEIADAIGILEADGDRDITLLHCTTQYPTPYSDVNLKAMQTLKDAFNKPVGYSDHTNGIEVSVAAAAMGATVIEKHFTLDRNMEGPDHRASLEPDELKKLVQSVRNVEQAIGNGEKHPAPCEIANRAVARKSIVALRDICCGETFSKDNITTKRPGSGINPMKWYEVIGKTAKRDFAEDELIEL